MVQAFREPSAHVSAKAYKIVLAKPPKVNLVYVTLLTDLHVRSGEDSLVLVC